MDAAFTKDDAVLPKRNLIIFILGLLATIGPFSIDMYLPGFPVIAESLGVTVDAVSYSLSSYFVGICLGQLIVGPMLDRFGRKSPLYVGLVIYILASIGCAMSNTLEALVIFRFFQALGGCLGIVAPRAMIRDLFSQKDIPKVFSLLILILGVSPILAPTVGGFVISHYGWHPVFYILAVITTLILLAVKFYLPESYAPDKSYSLKPIPILKKYWEVLHIRSYLAYTIVGASTSAALFGYISGAPFVYMNLFKQSEKTFGYIFAIIAAGLITCSQVNTFLLRKYTSRQILRVAITAQLIIGIILLLLASFGLLKLYSSIVFIALFLSCQGFVFPNATALSLEPFKRDAGSASALGGAIQMAMAALASALVGIFEPKTPIPMTAIMTFFVAIGTVTYYIFTLITVKPKQTGLK